MKKRLTALLLMLVLLIPTAVASAYYRVNTSWLKVHMLPESDSTVLDSYRKDWACSITKKYGSWSYVTFTNGKDGYVKTKYLKSCKSYKAYITKDDVKMWKGPDYSFGQAGLLAKGTKVTVYSHGDKYDYVSTSVGKGYVRNSFLSKKYVAPSGNASSSDATPPSEGYDAWVTNPNNRSVNLRTGPGKEYSVIASYKPETKIRVLEPGYIWSYIWVSGNKGYMMSEYITTTAPETPRPAGGNADLTGPPYTAYVYSPDGKSVNVHRGPGLGYANVCRVSLGTAVTVLDWTTRTWYKIEVNGKVGYIRSEYLIRDYIW